MNVVKGYLHTMKTVKGWDLRAFHDRHKQLYSQARSSGDHGLVTRAYYDLMAGVIEGTCGTCWHFCPPRAGESREAAIRNMHQLLCRLLEHGPGRRMLEIGCGIGGTLRSMALYSGGRLAGVTIGHEEIRRANELIRQAGLEAQCIAVEGDCQSLPFPGAAFDGAYAIYALKYLARIDRVLSEAFRVLRPGAPLVVYDIHRTDRYNPSDTEHVRLMKALEYATGMPPLLTAAALADAARQVGFDCETRMDISQEYPWYHDFVANPINAWLVTSPGIRQLVGLLEAVRFMPAGFRRFNDTFLAGTVAALIAMGRLGILTGSSVMVLRKPLEH
jgi:ubiquinone/menaquinone biosynthesis C-methylase UbiE